jgi:hypothetical protein
MAPVRQVVRAQQAARAAPDQDTEQEVPEGLDWQVAESHGEFGQVIIHNGNVSFPLQGNYL